MAEANKRAKLLMKTPNPLYLSWLEEWLVEAMDRNLPKRIRELTLAIKSLKKYPVRLNGPKECIILEDFSRQLVDEIEHREQLEARGEVVDPVLTHLGSTACISNRSPSKFAWSPPKSSIYGPSSPVKESKDCPVILSKPDAYKPKLSSPAKVFKPKVSSISKISKPERPGKAFKPNPSSPAMESLPKPPSLTRRTISPILPYDDPSWLPMHTDTSCSISSNIGKPPLAPDPVIDELSHRQQLSLVQDLIAPSKTTQRSRKKEAVVHDDVDDVMDLPDPPAPAETIIFPPGSFQIILLIDTGEKGFLNSVSDSSEVGFNHEVRHLKVGDYAWVARGPSQKELLLPFLVERKRLDDLCKSVKDGRFSEQKFRLKMSRIPNIIYLIENHDVRGNTQSIVQGISNMLIKDLFTVKETRDNMDAMRYLAHMTTYLSLTMADKMLMSGAEYDAASGLNSDLVVLPEFGVFFAGMGKLRTFTTKEMFTKQLVQLHGLSADKAWAIVSKYQTPKALIEAFQASGPSLLSNLSCGLLNRKLGQNVSNVLHKFYTSVDFV